MKELSRRLVMYMSLSRDTLFYSLASWGRRIIGFLVAPITIRYFTPDDFGYLSLVRTLTAFCSILGLLAVIDGLPRFFIDSQDESEKAGYVTIAYLIGSLGILVMLCLVLVSTPLVPLLFKDVHAPFLFTGLLALMCFAHSMLSMGSNMLKWTFQASLFTKVTFLQVSVGAVLSITGIIFWGWRAQEILLIEILVVLGAGIWSNSAIKQYIIPASLSKTKAKELLVYSWPLLGMNIFSFFTRSLDRLFLAGLASLDHVGIFSVASSVAYLFETLVTGFFLPGARMCSPHFGKIGLQNGMPNFLAPLHV